MSLADLFNKAFRFTVRSYEWARGWRHYPWSSSPPHRLFALIANRAQGFPGRNFRALYFFAGAALKFRERLFLDRVNFSAELRAPVNAGTLRAAAQWQQAILDRRPSIPRPHLNIRVHDADQVQLDRLVSTLLVSDVPGSIGFFFDDAGLLAARSSSSTVAEESRGLPGFDLNATHTVDAADFSGVVPSRVFSSHTGFDANVNGYLKVAHPGACIVAVSLPESDDGLCEHALPDWLEPLQRLAARIENVAIVVLNAPGPSVQARATSRSPVSFARTAGLSYAETLRLAQQADAFLGQLDAFGLAALAARRPGVYLGEVTGNAASPASQIFAAGITPAASCERLAGVLAARASEPRKPVGEPRNPSGEPRNGQNGKASKQERYTLVIPTFNRPQLLARLLRYLEREHATFPILVLDSSPDAAFAQNAEALAAAHLATRHLRFDPSLDPYAKIRDGLRDVGTSYCSICADDDVLIVTAAEKAVQELERRPDFAIAHGYYFNFIENDAFDLSYVMYRGASIDDGHALSRLRTLFSAYEAVFYGVFRTEVLRRAFRDVDQVSTVLAKELLTASLSVIAGKSLRIPHFYYGRNTAESLPYSAWHPHQILAFKPETLFADFPAFRSQLVAALQETAPGAQEENAVKAVDLIFLRYLEAFLRHDVLDLMLDMTMKGKESARIYETVWDVFVRVGQPRRPVEPLLDSRGRFNPRQFGAGRPRDYDSAGVAADGKERRYRLRHEFLFPQSQGAPFADAEMLSMLLRTLNDY